MSKEYYNPEYQETERFTNPNETALKILFKRGQPKVKIDHEHKSDLEARLLRQQSYNQFHQQNTPSLASSFVSGTMRFAVALIIVFAGILLFTSFLEKTSNNPTISENIQPNTPKVDDNLYAHFTYIPEPEFGNSIDSSIAAPSEYNLKDKLPTAAEVVEGSKLSLIPTVYAEDETYLPVFRSIKHEMTEDDALALAQKFGFTDTPQKEGFTPPASYEYKWETDSAYFAVGGGSGTGGFEYFIKGSALSGDAPSDEEASKIARKFLEDKGLITDDYIVSGILHNTTDISRRSGFREDRKLVYFRKKINKFQVFDWMVGQGSPTVDQIQVWVGVDGRILYTSYANYFTSIDGKTRQDVALKEPADVYENIKGGNGKLAWLDYDAIGVSTGGYGPKAPDGNFIHNGKLKNVVIEDVKLSYYHESKGIDEPEYYQPIYLFKAQATLDFKDGYTLSDADKFIQGKRTTVMLVAPAILDNYYFENPINISEGDTMPIYYPSIKPSPTPNPSSDTNKKDSFNLKVSAITSSSDDKRNVFLNWEASSEAKQYRVLVKVAGNNYYSQAAETIPQTTVYTLEVNKYVDYFIKVQYCALNNCQDSNEVFIPQQQKAAFNVSIQSSHFEGEDKLTIDLGWQKVPNMNIYNIFVKNSPTDNYYSPFIQTKESTSSLELDNNIDNYVIVQACNEGSCVSSNELLFAKR